MARERPKSLRPKMPPSERAKIFMPFNPLSGLQDALREREERVERAHYLADGVSQRLYMKQEVAEEPDIEFLSALVGIELNEGIGGSIRVFDADPISIFKVVGTDHKRVSQRRLLFVLDFDMGRVLEVAYQAREVDVVGIVHMVVGIEHVGLNLQAQVLLGRSVKGKTALHGVVELEWLVGWIEVGLPVGLLGAQRLGGRGVDVEPGRICAHERFAFGRGDGVVALGKKAMELGCPCADYNRVRKPWAGEYFNVPASNKPGSVDRREVGEVLAGGLRVRDADVLQVVHKGRCGELVVLVHF